MSTSGLPRASVATGSDVQKTPPTITTAELHRLVGRAEPLWLIYAPDDPGSGRGHIPGSLTTTDEDLLTALSAATPMVLYGDNAHATRAQTIAAGLASQGRDTRWYPGGLRAWADAGHPIDSA